MIFIWVNLTFLFGLIWLFWFE